MNNLKELREERGMSQRALAELSGVSVRMIQYYEQGTKDINKASMLTIYRLAQALNISIYILMGYKDIEEHVMDFGVEEYIAAMKQNDNNRLESYTQLVEYLHTEFSKYDDLIVWPMMIEKIISYYDSI